MQTKRLFPPYVFALALLGLLWPSASLWALGWGAPPQSVFLGATLDVALPLRLDAGETLTAECVSAEVQVGDSRVPAAQVRMRLDMASAEAGSLRVATTNAIDEPVVVINISAGCATRVSRRFVLLADPGPLPVVEAPVVLASPATAMVDQVMTAVVSSRSVVPVRASLKAAKRERRAAAPRRARASNSANATVVSRTKPLVQSPALPRLRLDMAEPRLTVSPAVVEEALEAVAQAASAARASAAAASAASERIANLERNSEKLRQDANAGQAAMDQMRTQLAKAQDASSWLVPLLAVLGMLALAAMWLVWRLRATQRSHDIAWARVSTQMAADPQPKETSPLPLITHLISAPAPLARTVPADPPNTTAAMPMAPVSRDIDELARERAMMRTTTLPAGARNGRGEDEPPRDVSIDELLDLEQQAEFFVALGQDSAAIDLLVAHLRNTGGGSPLTYLKLLEIYRRCGEHEAYERTRARFNQRYNAYAPDWGADLMHDGKALEDYTGVLPRLQHAWPRPLDAMAELEALLFRKSRGELFELPAYREVLFLYSVSRDLLDREPGNAGDVDLLLPLDVGAASVPAVGSARATSDIHDEDRPTAPVDLDLTPPPRAQSIFGELLKPSPGISSSTGSSTGSGRGRAPE